MELEDDEEGRRERERERDLCIEDSDSDVDDEEEDEEEATEDSDPERVTADKGCLPIITDRYVNMHCIVAVPECMSTVCLSVVCDAFSFDHIAFFDFVRSQPPFMQCCYQRRSSRRIRCASIADTYKSITGWILRSCVKERNGESLYWNRLRRECYR